MSLHIGGRSQLFVWQLFEVSGHRDTGWRGNMDFTHIFKRNRCLYPSHPLLPVCKLLCRRLLTLVPCCPASETPCVVSSRLLSAMLRPFPAT